VPRIRNVCSEVIITVRKEYRIMIVNRDLVIERRGQVGVRNTESVKSVN
jgi:hypothetical protein